MAIFIASMLRVRPALMKIKFDRVQIKPNLIKRGPCALANF